MRKALRIISISSGIISILSAVILGFIYLEDMAGCIKKIKNKIVGKIGDRASANQQIIVK